MILISHRGNISGPNPKRENTPKYIEEAISAGYDVEIDVWFEDNKFWLGHDKPEIEIEECYLENRRLWCHAKNLSSLKKMLNNGKIHCFWHQKDDYAITSMGLIWTYPGVKTNNRCILMIKERMAEKYNTLANDVFGICSDFVEDYKK